MDDIRLSSEDVHSSVEAVDGSALSAELIYPGTRVNEIAAGSHVITPSGRRYRITELRWDSEREGEWRVSLKGATA